MQGRTLLAMLIATDVSPRFSLYTPSRASGLQRREGLAEEIGASLHHCFYSQLLSLHILLCYRRCGHAPARASFLPSYVLGFHLSSRFSSFVALMHFAFGGLIWALVGVVEEDYFSFDTMHRA